MSKRYALLPLLLIPLALSACSAGGPTPSPSTPVTTASVKPTPAPTATQGQVLASVTASTNEGEATTFSVPTQNYKVQVLCEGDARAKLRVSVRAEGRQVDENHSVDATTNSAEFSCLSNKPYTLISTEPGKSKPTGSVLLRLEVLNGTVSHASATAVAQ